MAKVTKICGGKRVTYKSKASYKRAMQAKHAIQNKKRKK